MRVRPNVPVDDMQEFTCSKFPAGWVESGGHIFLVLSWIDGETANVVHFEDGGNYVTHTRKDRDNVKAYRRAYIEELIYGIGNDPRS